MFAGQNVGPTQVGERIWLATFMSCDLGYFDDETYRLEPIDNPFGPKVLPTLTFRGEIEVGSAGVEPRFGGWCVSGTVVGQMRSQASSGCPAAPGEMAFSLLNSR